MVWCTGMNGREAVLDRVIDTLLSHIESMRDSERMAFWDGQFGALSNAAMLAHDMGHEDVRMAIMRLLPAESPYYCEATSRGTSPRLAQRLMLLLAADVCDELRFDGAGLRRIADTLK